MYYVYILRMKNNQLYTGFTSDIERRLEEHSRGIVKSTCHRRPLKLIHYEVYLLESDARRRERFLKTSEGKRLLKKQIRDVLEKEKITKNLRRVAGVVERDGLENRCGRKPTQSSNL